MIRISTLSIQPPGGTGDQPDEPADEQSDRDDDQRREPARADAVEHPAQDVAADRVRAEKEAALAGRLQRHACRHQRIVRRDERHGQRHDRDHEHQARRRPNSSASARISAATAVVPGPAPSVPAGSAIAISARLPLDTGDLVRIAGRALEPDIELAARSTCRWRSGSAGGTRSRSAGTAGWRVRLAAPVIRVRGPGSSRPAPGCRGAPDR